LTIASALAQYHIAPFGLATTYHSDNGREFKNYELEEVLKVLEVAHTYSLAYSPSGNWVEHHHRTLEAVLKTTVVESQSNWSDALPWASLSMNTAVNRETGQTSYFLMFGRECPIPTEILYGLPPRALVSGREYARKLRETFETAYRVARVQQGVAHRRASRLYNKPYPGKEFMPGDKIWYWAPLQQKARMPGRVRKLHRGWIGPFVIEKKISDILYTISPHPEFGVATATLTNLVVTLDHITHYVESDIIPDVMPVEPILLGEFIDDIDPMLEEATPDSFFAIPDGNLNVCVADETL
jgi:hypothetical protein